MPSAAATHFDPAYATLEQLRAALDSQQLTSEKLVRYYLHRIARLDKRGPRINALISLNPLALQRARELDASAPHVANKSPVYGIPFVAKDNYDTAGLATTGGSAVLRHSIPAENAFVVQRLLDAGAILIGKTNMSELAASYGRLGYSSAGGLTVNPYDTARDASGSSSGSGAAVAADFAPFALGTDTTGSVRGPASVAGLVGLRPSMGLMSSAGIIPLSPSFDTPGVMARTVRDLAIVLDVVAVADPPGAPRDRPRPGSYLEAIGSKALRGVRFGVVENFRGGNAEVDVVEDAARERLRAAGAVLVPLILPAAFEDLWNAVLAPVGEAEFKPAFERYLRSLPPGQPRSLAELIARSTADDIAKSATPVNPARLEALRLADRSAYASSPAFERLRGHTIPGLRSGLRSLMESQRLQALVFSTMACPAAPRFDRPDVSYQCHSADSYRSAYIAAVMGFPEITVPAGRVSYGIPVGYSFLGLASDEASLLAFAGAFEAGVPQPRPSTARMRQ